MHTAPSIQLHSDHSSSFRKFIRITERNNITYQQICLIVPIAALLLYLFYNLKDKDAELMAQCNAGKITREECESRLSRKY